MTIGLGDGQANLNAAMAMGAGPMVVGTPIKMVMPPASTGSLPSSTPAGDQSASTDAGGIPVTVLAVAAGAAVLFFMKK